MQAKRQWNPIFNPWWAFELLPQHFFQIFELEYKGICWDQMQKIQDFHTKKKDDTHHIMYMKLAQFAKKMMMLSWNNSWCNYTCPNKTRKHKG